MIDKLVIQSSSNYKYKFFKSLLNKKYRTKEKLFFVEGIKVIKEALIYKSPEFLVISENFEDEIIDNLSSKIRIYWVKESLFKNLCDTKNSQGIIAYFRHIHFSKLNTEEGKYLYLDDLQDPGNVGGLIRSADAFNLNGLILSKNSVELYNPKLLRSTMASIFRIPIYILEDKEELLRAKEKGFKLVTTSIEEASSSYQYEFHKNAILILGNEANGVSDEIINLADEKVYIPMNDRVNSLNVNVAGSILCYEMMR
ncbi:MAG: TrmH family RNA methyltransferase [Peptoniphilaceae bacterium]